MHPLTAPDVATAVAAAVAAHLGRPWSCEALVDLGARASHPAAILRGDGFDVFAKLGGADQLAAEARGLRLVGERAGVLVPEPIGGVLTIGETAVLLLAALTECACRGRDEWRAIGSSLAALHDVPDALFGLAAFDGWFGPLRQDNRPSDDWQEFWRARRVEPARAAARAAGRLPLDLDRRLDAVLDRLDALAGPAPTPSLLHGDAQQHNFVSTPAGAALIDVTPYFGHPEVDLAMLGVFAPVPDDVFAAYAERRPLDAGFAGRVELWRLPADLAVVAVDGDGPHGRAFLDRLDAALRTLG